MVAKSLGINNILVLDVHDKKIDTALSLGASAGFNVLSGNPIEFINNQTDNIGVDFCIESAGKRDSMELAFAITKQKGKCVLAGNLPKGDLISIDPMDLIQGKKLIGSAGGDSILNKDIPQYTEWFEEGKLELNKMITNVYSLDKINVAFEELLQGKVARNLISL
jgi:Zn-dependent alcohol dehydrogenase